MTADINSAETTGGDAAPPVQDRTSAIVRWHFIVAAVFLVLSVLDLAFATLALVFPEINGNAGPLTYGRLLPAATDAFLYGFLTIGFIGAALYIVPRVANATLQRSAAAAVALVLVGGGVVAGTIAIALGLSEGRRYLEMPLWAAAAMLVGFFLAAWSITATAAKARERLGPPAWYLVAASWWLVLAWFAGNLPGIAGFNGAIQTSFYRASVTGLWFVAAGVGVVYYVLPRIVGADPRAASRLASLGFWSLAIVWVGTGARDFVYGPGPDWFETFGVAFSIALIVPVLIIFSDFSISLRGRWGEIADRVTLRFITAGSFMFLIAAAANMLVTLRTSSAVVQYTAWVTAYDYLLFYGALSMWLFAVAYRALNNGRAPARSVGATWHLRSSVLGLMIALFGSWMGGVQAGFIWAAGANTAVNSSTGEGFFNTASALDVAYGLRALGIAVFALAQLLFAFNAFRTGGEDHTEDVAAGDDVESFDLEFAGSPKVISWNRLRYGAVALFAVAALFAWLLPSLDPATTEATLLADQARAYPVDSPEARGREIFIAEGCSYCHTQSVRAVVTDVGLGPVSLAGDYVHESPILLGTERIGPDLMHAGSREGTSSYRFVSAHLQDPRAERPWSTMPSYAYLSETDIDALTLYLIGLE